MYLLNEENVEGLIVSLDCDKAFYSLDRHFL